MQKQQTYCPKTENYDHNSGQLHLHEHKGLPEFPAYVNTLWEFASHSRLTLLKVTQDYVKQRRSKCRHLGKDNEMLCPMSWHYGGGL